MQMSHQPSEQGVAPRLMGTDNGSFGEGMNSREADTVRVLMTLLEGFVRETPSEDVMVLSIGRAEEKLRKTGVSFDVYAPVLKEFARWASAVRQKHPMAGMF